MYFFHVHGHHNTYHHGYVCIQLSKHAAGNLLSAVEPGPVTVLPEQASHLEALQGAGVDSSIAHTRGVGGVAAHVLQRTLVRHAAASFLNDGILRDAPLGREEQPFQEHASRAGEPTLVDHVLGVVPPLNIIARVRSIECRSVRLSGEDVVASTAFYAGYETAVVVVLQLEVVGVVESIDVVASAITCGPALIPGGDGGQSGHV